MIATHIHIKEYARLRDALGELFLEEGRDGCNAGGLFYEFHDEGNYENPRRGKTCLGCDQRFVKGMKATHTWQGEHARGCRVGLAEKALAEAGLL